MTAAGRRALLLAMVLTTLSGCAGATRLAGPGVRTTPSADGVAIAYEVHGRGPRTLVFVHGWSCDRGYWREQVGAFRDQYRVVTLDLAGHGESGTGRSDWSIAAFAADVAAVIHAVGARDVVLVGHSLGGPVAVETALQLPERVRGVVGVDTLLDTWGGPGMAQMIAALRGDFAGMARKFVREGMFVQSSPPELADWVAADMAAAPPAVALPALDGLASWVDGRLDAAVAALPAPLGFVMPEAHVDRLLRVLTARGSAPFTSIETLANVGHFLQLEAPVAFNERLQDLLQQVPAAAPAAR